MEKKLFKLFDKKKCGYYSKTDNIVLNCLRGMCKEMGLNLVKKQLTKTIQCKFILLLNWNKKSKYIVFLKFNCD